MDQDKKTVVLAIFNGVEDSDDIEMSLSDVLAIVKRLGKPRVSTVPDSEQSDQPDCQLS